jgi:hypothetical protein
MQQELPLFGPSVHCPFSDEDEQLELDEPDVVAPDVPPEVPPDVPPDVPPEVPPELEPPPSSDEEHAAIETAKRRAEESEAIRAMFMPPRHGPSNDVASISTPGRRFRDHP